MYTDEEFAVPSMFQSTLPRRERPCKAVHFGLYSSFNPRSREGSDGMPTNVYWDNAVSIHAPAKGATTR